MSDIESLTREVERLRKVADCEFERADAAERRLADLIARLSKVMSAISYAIGGVSAARDTLTPRSDARETREQ